MGKEVLRQRASWRSADVDGSPDYDSEECDPVFQEFVRTLPIIHNSSTSACITMQGQKTPTIGVPRSLMRLWFPKLDQPPGQKFTVKIDGRHAKSPDEVKIWTRLDSAGHGLERGKWFNLVSFTANRRCSERVWKYVQRHQSKNAK